MDLSSNTKPLLYLFSKPTCGACKRLKAEFIGKAGKDLVRASRDYLMINISGDEENKKFSVGSLTPALGQQRADEGLLAASYP